MRKVCPSVVRTIQQYPSNNGFRSKYVRVANCTIEGKQCTIGWYVDDTKITHENPNVVTDVLNTLESEFGKMSITRGDEHVFLSMTITYNRKKRTATIDMKDYLAKAIVESGLAITKAAMTPAAKDLFSISAQCLLS